jgi:hypothetical protein
MMDILLGKYIKGTEAFGLEDVGDIWFGNEQSRISGGGFGWR